MYRTSDLYSTTVASHSCTPVILFNSFFLIKLSIDYSASLRDGAVFVSTTNRLSLRDSYGAFINSSLLRPLLLFFKPVNRCCIPTGWLWCIHSLFTFTAFASIFQTGEPMCIPTGWLWCIHSLFTSTPFASIFQTGEPMCIPTGYQTFFCDLPIFYPYGITSPIFKFANLLIVPFALAH